MLKKPGASLLFVGLLLMFIVRPLISKLPYLGSVASPVAFFIGLFGIIGGGYLIARSTFGKG